MFVTSPIASPTRLNALTVTAAPTPTAKPLAPCFCRWSNLSRSLSSSDDDFETPVTCVPTRTVFGMSHLRIGLYFAELVVGHQFPRLVELVGVGIPE